MCVTSKNLFLLLLAFSVDHVIFFIEASGFGEGNRWRSTFAWISSVYFLLPICVCMWIFGR
ncbi:hypothetical protein B0J14DRAFT_572308 [Halenospora varia]|nr:hypothetical protein B0J14DRAFT_572308 [Halenospora varia]